MSQEKEFRDHLQQFLNELYKISSSKQIKDILDRYEEMKTKKLAKKIYSVLQHNTQLIHKKDTIIFNNNLIILPGVNLSDIWKKCSTEQQNTIWLYLELLSLSCSIILSEEETLTNRFTEQSNDAAEIIKKMPFDPLQGIGKSNQDYSLSDIYTQQPESQQEAGSSMIGNVASMLLKSFDLNKYIDVQKLIEKANKYSDKDFEDIMEKVKTNYCSDIDETSYNDMKEMGFVLIREIRKIDTTKKIDAITFFEKMMPYIKIEKINMEYFVNALSLYLEKYGGESKQQLGFILQMLKSQVSLLKNVQTSDPKDVDQQMSKMKNDCQNMLQQLGMSGAGLNLQNICKNFEKQANQQNDQKSRRKK